VSSREAAQEHSPRRKQAAEKLDVALDFGWRSGLPLR